ncbi:MAG: magnesium transporter [Gammaproteobacteria bacterium]|nr:MAG: magnesium transporter [Gammaproteobacteria bacterium]
MKDNQEEKILSPLAEVREALSEDNTAAVSEAISDLEPAEIARTLESLPPVERDQVWEVVPNDEQGQVLANLGGDVLEDVVEEMSPTELFESAQQMDDDDLVDFIQDLPDDKALGLLQSFDGEQRAKLVELLEYDDETAGGMMNTDSITVRPDTRVGAVIRYFRRLEEVPDATVKVFVVDRESHLLGEVRLAELIIAKRQQHIEEIMRTEFTAFHVNTDAMQVAQQFREHDLLAAGVVNDNNQLVGRITVDDVIDVIQEEAEKQLLNTAGLDEEVDTFAPIKQAAISRGLWLGINLLTALLAASVINAFGATIEKVVALAALSPLVASMGGIAGSQSLTIIIRGMALGQIEGANAKILLGRELLIGLINGVVWGAVTAAISLLWFGQLNLALIVVSAIFANLCVAALSGVLIPLLLKKLNIDPALAGSVILTTVTDVVGFLVLLGLAAMFL